MSTTTPNLLLKTLYSTPEQAEKARQRLRASSGRTYSIIEVEGDRVESGRGTSGLAGVEYPSESAEGVAAARMKRNAALTAADWAWRHGEARESLVEILEALGIDRTDLVPRPASIVLP